MSVDHVRELEALVRAEKQQRLNNELARKKSAEDEEKRSRLRAIASASYAKTRMGDEEFVMIPVRNGACCGKATPGLLADRATRLAVIVCHPWGPLGGSMFDLNLSVLLDPFTRAGVTTLRFNFRTGLDCGMGAAADLRAACEYLLTSTKPSPPTKLLLVGYSYGSLVVAEVAPTIDACCAFALVAPPLGTLLPLYGLRGDPTQLAARSTKPKLALIGSHDQFCSAKRFEAWSGPLAQPCESHIMHGPEVVQQCHSGCEHRKTMPIAHHNVYEVVVDGYLRPWVEQTFGCDMEQLASSDGSTS